MRLLLLLVLTPVLGCSRQTIRVVDPTGAPIPGAQVEAVSDSINGKPAVTDAEGQARMPSNVQGAKWIAISKPGFERVQTEVPESWPLDVTLQPGGELTRTPPEGFGRRE